VIVPFSTRSAPHSAEKRPEASVAVWLVTDHVKFEQLEKSGSEPGDAFGAPDAVFEVPWTTQTPSRDGVDVFGAEALAALVGPSTVDVRSTPHAAVAANAASTELNRTNDFFMG
jgi:hypothetical protein